MRRLFENIEQRVSAIHPISFFPHRLPTRHYEGLRGVSVRGAWTDWLAGRLPSGSCAHVRGCIGQLSPNQRIPCAMTEASRRKCGFREATFPKLQGKAQPHLAGDDVKSIGQRAAGLADPVLNCSELPWRGTMAWHFPHQLFVQFANETDAEWRPLEPRNLMLQGNDVVANFSHFFRTAIYSGPCCGRQWLAASTSIVLREKIYRPYFL